MIEGLIFLVIFQAALNVFLIRKLRKALANNHRHPKGALDSEGKPMGGKFKKAGD